MSQWQFSTRNIFFFLAVLGPHCCEWDLSLVVVIGASTVHCDIRGTFLILVASLVEGGQASVAMAHGLSSWGSWALEHRLSRCGAQA